MNERARPEIPRPHRDGVKHHDIFQRVSEDTSILGLSYRSVPKFFGIALQLNVKEAISVNKGFRSSDQATFQNALILDSLDILMQHVLPHR